MPAPVRIAVTSAVRHAGASEFSGYLRLVDLETGDVSLTTTVPESSRRADDPNPRGGLRGARGVSTHGDRLVLANSERLFVFDSTWALVGDTTNPLMGAIHDVLAREDGVWIACSACDLLLKVDWSGNPVRTWTWRADPDLVAALGFDSVPPFDPSIDHRDPRIAQQGVHNIVHLNGVGQTPQGLLLSFGRVLDPAVVRARLRKARLSRLAGRVGLSRPLPTRETPVPASQIPGSSHAIVLLPDHGAPRVLLHRSGTSVPNHNVDMLDRWLVYLDSNGGRLVVWDPVAGEERTAVPVPGTPSFARGLLRVGERRYLVGSQAPTALHLVDLDRERVVSSLELGGLPNESVYGLCPVPESFGWPPPAGSLFAESPPSAAGRYFSSSHQGM